MKKHYRKHSAKGPQAQPGMVAIVDSKDMWNKGAESVTTQCYVPIQDLEIQEGYTVGDLCLDYLELKSKSEKVEKLYKFFTNFAKRLEQTSYEVKGAAKYNAELKAELMKEKSEKDRLFDLIAAEFSEEEGEE